MTYKKSAGVALKELKSSPKAMQRTEETLARQSWPPILPRVAPNLSKFQTAVSNFPHFLTNAQTHTALSPLYQLNFANSLPSLSMASNTNTNNSTATSTMTDSGNPLPVLTAVESLTLNAETPEALSSSVPKSSEGASTESEPNATAAKERELVCVGRNNRAMTWGYSLHIGRRQEMEDAVTIVPSFMKLPCTAFGGCTAPECKYATVDSSVHYFGLFDGHGGAQVSRYCSKKLHELLAEEWNRGSNENEWDRRWKGALTRAYNRADDAFIDNTLALDTVGTTAVVVILSACQIIVANCGDSRAVLCRGSQVIPLTFDHKPDRADELVRVTEAGGRILYVGCPTVEGVLAMTRAIGDQDLKPWVISEPEVSFLTRTDTDECLILASDGLWDVMSNDEVMAMTCRMLKDLRKQYIMSVSSVFSPAQYVAERVLENALRTSTDNVSVIVIDLKRLRKRMQQKAEADI